MVVGTGSTGTVVSQSAHVFSSVEVAGALGTLEVVDVQSSHGSSALVVDVSSTGLSDVELEAQSSQDPSSVEVVVAVVVGSTGLLEVVDDSQSAHESSLSVVEGETDSLDVVVVFGQPP